MGQNDITLACLGGAEAQFVAANFSPGQSRDLARPASGQQDEPDRIGDIAPANWRRFQPCPELCQLLRIEKATPHAPSIAPYRFRRIGCVRRQNTCFTCKLQHAPQMRESLIGTAGTGGAVGVKPLGNVAGRETVDCLVSERRQDRAVEIDLDRPEGRRPPDLPFRLQVPLRKYIQFNGRSVVSSE